MGKFETTATLKGPEYDWATAGAALQWQISPRLSVFLDYETHLFRDREESHKGSIRVSYRF